MWYLADPTAAKHSQAPTMSYGPLLAFLAWLLPAPAIAAEPVAARLKAHAVLPAQTVGPPPEAAPRSLIVSGRFAGGSPLRVDALGSITGG